MSRQLRICKAKGGERGSEAELWPAEVDPFFMMKKNTLGGVAEN